MKILLSLLSVSSMYSAPTKDIGPTSRRRQVVCKELFALLDQGFKQRIEVDRNTLSQCSSVFADTGSSCLNPEGASLEAEGTLLFFDKNGKGSSHQDASDKVALLTKKHGGGPLLSNNQELTSLGFEMPAYGVFSTGSKTIQFHVENSGCKRTSKKEQTKKAIKLYYSQGLLPQLIAANAIGVADLINCNNVCLENTSLLLLDTDGSASPHLDEEIVRFLRKKLKRGSVAPDDVQTIFKETIQLLDSRSKTSPISEQFGKSENIDVHRDLFRFHSEKMYKSLYDMLCLMANTTADHREEMLREIKDKKKFPLLDFGALHDDGIQGNTFLDLLDDCIADIEDELNDGKPNDQQLTKVVTQLTSVLTNQPEAMDYIDIAPNGTWGLKKQIEKLSTQDTPPTVEEVHAILNLLTNIEDYLIDHFTDLFA